MIPGDVDEAWALDRQNTKYVLDALTQTAAREHQLTYKAGLELLEHAILCGEALIAMKDLVEPRTWTQTLKRLEPTLGFTVTTAFHYMRISLHRDQVAAAGIETVTGAIELLRADERRLPAGHKSQWVAGMDVKRVLADELFETTDYTIEQISEMVGVDEPLVQQWIDPTPAKRVRRQKLKKKGAIAPASPRIAKELERLIEAQTTVQQAGVSEAYSQLRRLAQSLDRLYRDGANVAIRSASGNALKHVHKAEDAFIAALKELP